MTLRAVVVDDEPLARERVRQLLAAEPDVAVVGECRNGAEALSAIVDAAPDLVLLDVQMPEMDGFEVLAALGPDRLPAVVFVTAYDQYALRAFEFHAVDYLLKPLDGKRLRDALGRVRERLAQRDAGDASRRLLGLLAEVQQHRRWLQRFAVRSAGRIALVPVRDVEAIEADGNYMRIHVDAQHSHLVRETMEELADRLDPQRFVRVHRSWIVNVDQVLELHSWFHGSHVLVLKRGRRVPVGRKYRGVIAGLVRQ
jgi:two-component system, LytTR family, response regulator